MGDGPGTGASTGVAALVGRPVSFTSYPFSDYPIWLTHSVVVTLCVTVAGSSAAR